MSVRTRTRGAVALGLGLLVGLLGAPGAGADTAERRPARIEMVNLTPTITSGFGAEAHLVNDRGVVVGHLFPAAPHTNAFTWRDGTLVQLADLGGGTAIASSINSRGQIAGRSTTSDGRLHAVVWEADGTPLDLDPDGAYSGAAHINRRGTVLGDAGADFLSSRPVLWRDGAMLETVPGAEPALHGAGDLNDRDVAVVNVLDESTDVMRPVLWDGGIVTPLPEVGSLRGAWGRLLNNEGVVAGHERDEDGSGYSPFDGIVWEGLDVVRLSPGGQAQVEVVDMNDRGEVVGHFGQCGQCTRRGFVAEDGALTNLPALGGEDLFSRPFAINRRGQIVGESLTADGRLHATLWQDRVPVDLGSLGGNSRALDINRRGQIVGFSEDDEGVTHAVMWTVRR